MLLWPDAIDAGDAAALRPLPTPRRQARRRRRAARALARARRARSARLGDGPLGVDAHARAAAGDRGRAHDRPGRRGAASSPPAPPPRPSDDAASSLAAVARVGAGRAVLLADASPLLNGRLAARDDAAFALAVAGAGRPVAFVESVHGYGRASGWGALPGRFRGALVLLGLAGAVLVLARGRRLGPAQPAGRELAPARAAYAEGLAGALVRAGPPGGGDRAGRGGGARLLLVAPGRAATTSCSRPRAAPG